MAIDKISVKKCINSFSFAALFTEELGWDRYNATLPVFVGGRSFGLQAVAEKRGFVVWHFSTPVADTLPDSALRRKIEHEVAKAVHEHLIIFTDAANSLQVWQWVRREPNKPLRIRETFWYRGQTGELLVQKLITLFVSLTDEETITLMDVTSRVGANINERVTKRFYDEFRTHHTLFLKFISGIPNQGNHEWYASVMLNRLMFLYFVQRKGFLDGDTDYLRNRLVKLKATHGTNQFYSFYRYFLLRLFHEGLGAKQRNAGLEELVGRIPYLNGGIFDVHKLERSKREGGYGEDICISDQAFEMMFDYFDRFQWHLDERPLRSDDEINPDVLGYIFEKYINQKQMGAYYTREDITEYIGKSTILPFLLEAVQTRVPGHFNSEVSIWSHLKDDPDRYIYPAMRHGTSWLYQPDDPEQGQSLGSEYPFPDEIAASITCATPSLIQSRQQWNKPTPSTHGLPTETWRDTVERRQRCIQLREKLRNGEVRSVSDLVSLNLDISRFIQDVVSRCDSPELLAAFWHSLAGHSTARTGERPLPPLSILDPTCGSGAFLFAALNLLEPLYEACLDRMEGLLADFQASGKTTDLDEHLAEFEHILQRVAEHPNERYFIFKTIILHNLYGVDLMEEAVEICKLRLFLKLASQIEPDNADSNFGIEPLPDIDFNIKAGNTLVGYGTSAEIETVGRGDFIAQEQVKEVIKAAADAAIGYENFIRSQLDGTNSTEYKRRLDAQLLHVRDRCDRFLAERYRMGITDKPIELANWKTKHQPFHWFVEFFDIVRNGGFDVIIGNPPYVELSNIAGQYSIKDSSLFETGNLYALCVERFTHLLRKDGFLGVIVPISSVSTPRMLPLMQFISESFSELHLSHFAVRPGKLFVGVDMNLTIVLGKRGNQLHPDRFLSTRYNRWNEEGRSTLFSNITYAATRLIESDSAIPKTGSVYSVNLLRKICEHPSFANQRDQSSQAKRIFYHSGGRYFRKCLLEQLSNEYKPLNVKREFGEAAICLLSSSLYYWFWIGFSDCYHVTKGDIDAMPAPNSLAADSRFALLATRLLDDLWRHADRRVRNRKDGSKREEVNFHVGMSKSIIDEIDMVLAEHYSLSVDELDFVMNFDAKYRFANAGGIEE